MKQAATVFGFAEGFRVAVLDQSSFWDDRSEIDEVEPSHHGHNPIWAGDSVGVEADALAADGKTKIQVPPWCEDALEIRQRLGGAIRIDRVPIPTEPNMLDDMKARERA